MTEAALANYYDVLGVSPQASLDEIRAAYHARLKVFAAAIHSSDKPQGNDLDLLRQAFSTLVDPQARHAYDTTLNADTNASQGSGGMSPLPIGTGNTDPKAEEPPVDFSRNFRFTGDGGEYFRIWIVNLCLSILTLGIYSAWAKVRREQYFHRNLQLDGSGFEYHAKPAAILKGRVIAFAMLGVFSGSQHLGATAHGAVFLCLMLLFPWLVVRTMRFRALNTSYRGLRFGFEATYWQAFKIFIGYGILVTLSLGLAFPLYYRQMRKFVIDHARFGSTPFACDVGIGLIYRIFVLPGLASIAMMIGVFVLALQMAPTKGGGGAPLLFPFIMLLPVMAYLLIHALIVVRTSNAVWSHTRLGAHRFSCDLPVGGYLGLALTNWLGILFTLGLFSPWAKVRMARFRAEHLAIHAFGGLDDFVAGETSKVSAVGDEAAEMFDMDIAL